MRPVYLSAAAVAAVVLSAAGAHAGACDYKPSKLAGEAGGAVSSGVSTGAAAAVSGAKAAGHYALAHPTSSLAAISSAASSASGIAAGASGVAATLGGILTAPVTLTVGAITFGAAGAWEGLCYFSVDRVTDPYEVRRILEDVAANDPEVAITRGDDGDRLVLGTGEASESYLLRKLYIADGVLKHRDWLNNTNLGTVAFVAPETAGG